jgi:hypothetical protein
MAIEIGDTCKKGHEISGDNVQYYTNQKVQRVRCSICNQPPRNMLVKKKPGDICRNGHTMLGDNLGTKTSGDKVTYHCRECGRIQLRQSQDRKYNRSQAERDKRDRLQSKSALQAARRASDRADQLIESGKEDNALNYLQLNKRSERASDSMQNAMGGSKAKCAGKPAAWMDYEDEDTPTKRQAYFMCEGCPLLVQCARFASAYKPAVGVWGGEVYYEGKLLH